MTVLFAPSAVGLTPLRRCLLVARALRERGTEAVFAYGGNRPDLIDAERFERLPLADVPAADPLGDAFAAYDRGVLEAAVADGVTAVTATGARVVAFAWHPAGAILAQAAGVPCASITDAALMEQFDVAALMVDAGEQPARYRRLDRIARPVRTVHARGDAWAMRRVAERHGMSGRRSLFDFQRGDITLLADLESWAPLRHPVDGVRYVGPLVCGEDEAGAGAAVDLGDCGDARVAEVVQEALVSGPDRPVPTSTVAIHCGDSGATYRALRAGRPMIVIPFSEGQRVTARLVVRHRVGAAFEPARLDAARLRDALQRIGATPGYRVMAARFALELEAADPAGAAADAILGLARDA